MRAGEFLVNLDREKAANTPAESFGQAGSPGYAGKIIGPAGFYSSREKIFLERTNFAGNLKEAD
jgi:hypothetical protein